MARIHIFGASGSGVTTLGHELSKSLGIPVFDADNYYWKKTDPPFLEANPIESRHSLLLADLSTHKDWILSGSMDSWSEPFRPLFQLAVFVYVPADIRVARLKRRESAAYGERLLPGGDMEKMGRDFIAWAAQYDEGLLAGRSLKRHEEWMKTLACPVLRIEGDRPLAECVRKTLATLSALSLP